MIISRIPYFLTFFVLCVVTACVHNQQPVTQTQSLSWVEKIAKQSWCRDTSLCAEFLAEYPLFEGDSAVASILNTKVKSFASSLVSEPEDSVIFTVDFCATKLVNDFKAILAEEPDGIMQGWSIEMKSKVLYHNSQIVTLDNDAYSYLGGAHPITIRSIETYNRKTGLVIGIRDLVRDSIGLSKLLELKYKEAKDVAPDSDLKELTFEGSPLPLPTNMAIVEEGILFYYSDYEVAAYAVGNTEIVIAWAELGNLVHENVWK